MDSGEPSKYTPRLRESLMRSRRLLVLLAFGLLLAQATVVTSFQECQSCISDDDCPSSCETCVCCTMARVDVPSPTDVCALTPMGTVLPSPSLPRHSAYPQEIFHVPRLSLS